MHFKTALVGLFSTIVLANQNTPLAPSISSTPSLETPSLNQPSETALYHIQTAQPKKSIPSMLGSLIDAEEDLRKRQAPGQVAGDAAQATVATQLSPITTYLAYGPDGSQTPAVFTQLFSATPDPWSAPLSGSIGLGTITGQVGVVKTKVKRDIAAEATLAVKKLVEKRATSGGVSTFDVSRWGTTFVVGATLCRLLI